MRPESMATPHHGRNIKRIREILGIKQEALAMDLGISQQAISALEQKEALDKDILEKVANVLKVPSEAIKNFNEEHFISIVQNNYEGSSNNYSGNYYCTFNPLDKIVELYDEKIALYERMLKDKNEMIERLERLIETKK